MANEFWMTDRQWMALEPLIPLSRRGLRPKRNWGVISGIVHILKVGCRWRNCPEVCGPHTTIYNSKSGSWLIANRRESGRFGRHEHDTAGFGRSPNG